MKDTERYMGDQFPFRDICMAVKSEFVQLIGNKEVNGVYIGKNGYLFEKWLDNDVNMVRLQKNIDAVKAFSRNYDNQKINIMIIPTSSLILKNNLPKNAPIFNQNKIFDQVTKEFSKSNFIDIREILSSHNKDYIYYKTDHHWTTYGAFLAYSQWCKSNGFATSMDDFEIAEATNSFKGSLYSKVLNWNSDVDTIEIYTWKEQVEYTVNYNFGKSQSNSVYAFENLEKKDKYQMFLNGNHPEITIETDKINGKHLLVFKDSFANAFIPFLLNDYESIHVIDLRYFNDDIRGYITDKGITEFLFLYNIKNFCEEKTIDKLNN